MAIYSTVTTNIPTAPQGILDKRMPETLWFNALWFQSVWFAAVMGRDSFLPLVLCLLALHLCLVGRYRRELQQFVLVGSVGIATDALLSVTGVYQFAGGVLVPLWLCGLWFAFSAVLGRSLGWLLSRPLLSALCGAIAFPLNYWAGQRLGGVQFGYPLGVTLLVVAMTWGLVLPMMFRLTAVLQRDFERRLG